MSIALMKKLVALKVDVDTLKGTLVGVPALQERLKAAGAGATFLFSLGPDHTGRAIRRAFRKGFLGKVKRTSVVEHYGFPTLLYGTLLPGPDIGQRAAASMRAVRDAGFETGIHAWDHVKWQDGVAGADEAWARREMGLAISRYQEIFGEPAAVHGAAGWQMSRAALRLEAAGGLAYASDGRADLSGTPHFPVVDGEIIDCPQIPTTLPTLDELIGLDGCTAENVHDRLLGLTVNAPQPCPAARESVAVHVFTLHAELEGMRLAPAFERLLAGWQGQGYHLVDLRTVCGLLDRSRLPYHSVAFGPVPGRSGNLMLQGRPFPQGTRPPPSADIPVHLSPNTALAAAQG
ncbi:MAG TPA: 4-deoxy-4-formamido-L-arabinose-phosphoundecaprenol deformylase [Usitatibacteraceae bacterium]|nr:4-deoxy-4-formamido-L-arabinose-phosphoundecaprenol deformylase [Usitatibacteraceae bacterium]